MSDPRLVGPPGPHHDGSELFVPPQTPALGDVVPVRIRVPETAGVHDLRVRVLVDAEPTWVKALPDGDGFFAADVPVANPVTNYRVLLDRGAGRVSWLNGTGEHQRDVTDQHDFRLTSYDPGPDWALDAAVYQVFPDRFATTGPKPTPDWAIAADWDDTVLYEGPHTPLQLFGGDLDGVTAHLDHLVDLGVSTVYLTPVFPGRSNHRYNATTFSRVDPLLGGDDALQRLSAAAHARGLHLVGDLTTNHSGDDHEWFVTALADPAAAERGFYYVDPDGSYASWLGFLSLPKFDLSSPELRARLFGAGESVVARWLRPPFDLDGWRIDVANMTGRFGAHNDTTTVARAIRETLDEVKPGSVLIAEHCHDASGDLVGDGWQGTMNYGGFTRPVWCWLTSAENGLSGFLGVPFGVPRRPGPAVVATMRDFASSVAWKVAARQWNLLGSHDTPRIATVTQSPAAQRLAAALLFTYPGTPMMFAGDEIGLGGTNGEHSRTPFPWEHTDRWDTETLAAYRVLLHLRREHRALRRGGLRWVIVTDDAIGYLRETADERILVVIARAPWSGAVVDRQWLGDDAELLYGELELVGNVVSGAGPGVGIWRLG